MKNIEDLNEAEREARVKHFKATKKFLAVEAKLEEKRKAYSTLEDTRVEIEVQAHRLKKVAEMMRPELDELEQEYSALQLVVKVLEEESQKLEAE